MRYRLQQERPQARALVSLSTPGLSRSTASSPRFQLGRTIAFRDKRRDRFQRRASGRRADIRARAFGHMKGRPRGADHRFLPPSLDGADDSSGDIAIVPSRAARCPQRAFGFAQRRSPAWGHAQARRGGTGVQRQPFVYARRAGSAPDGAPSFRRRASPLLGWPAGLERPYRAQRWSSEARCSPCEHGPPAPSSALSPRGTPWWCRRQAKRGAASVGLCDGRNGRRRATLVSRRSFDLSTLSGG
jgi:hypothetical protein